MENKEGNADARWSELYPDLKRLARQRLRRSGPNHLLQTTGLVNEAYLRLARHGALDAVPDGQFLAFAACTMRNVIVDLVRESRAQKRGGGETPITLNTAVIDGVPAQNAEDVLRLDEALTALARAEPRLCQVVEMRSFAGLTEEEIGAALGVTSRTVRRDWTKARLLLRAMLQE